MQSDSHHVHPEDASPLPTPTSPTMTAFHRPQPTPTPMGEVPEPLSHLRRRIVPSTLNNHNEDVGETLRISIQTPFGDTAEGSSRRKEGWIISRSKLIQDLKDELAAGAYEMGAWDREGMRIVYQGRIARDHERLGDVVGKTINPDHTYAFHLVARRGPPTPLPRFEQFGQFSRQPSRLATPAPPLPTTQPTQHAQHRQAPTTTSTSSSTISTNTLALSDTVHYLLFTARYHMFLLLGRPPLEWHEVIPPPTVEQSKAREAVMSVVKAYETERGSREEGWEDWQAAFEGDTRDDLKVLWEKMEGRAEVEKVVKTLWATNVGRGWNDQAQVEKVDVEVDGRTYSVHLPQLRDMTAAQLAHLLVYLRIVSLIPLLNNVLEQSLTPPVPTMITTFIPTPTIPLPGRVIYRRQFRLVVPSIPIPVLQHVFFSALKVSAMIWMLTRGMRWSDARFWIIAGAAGGWWLADGAAQLSQHRRAARAAVPRPTAPAPDAAQAGEPGADQAAPEAGAGGAAAEIRRAQEEVQAEGDRHRRRALQSGSIIPSFIPLFHLDVDAAQLGLSNSSTITQRPPARSRPPRWQTQLVLPVYLWFMTLIPEWESTRARAIRRRERAIRSIVGEGEAGQTNGDVNGNEGGGGDQQSRLPEGLSVYAIKYYTRVMERGEGIDWEEEREAQRAMGVGEEEAEDEGMRLRML